MLVLEHLPPSWWSWVVLHISRFSWGFDIEWLILLSRSYSSWWLMEVPFLAVSTILSLDQEVSWEIVNISSCSQKRNDMEISIDNETVFSIPLTLGWFTLPVLGVDKIPLLACSSMESTHVDISVFGIDTSWNIHSLVGFLSISEEWSWPLEELEPSWVHGSASKVSSFLWENVRSPVHASDSLWNWIESELLCLSTLSPFLEDNVVSTDTFSNSLHWKFGSEVEWFINNETVSFALLTLLSVSVWTSQFSSIDNSPSLGGMSICFLYMNWLSFSILVILNSNVFSFFTKIDKVFSLVLEHLPPVGVGAVVLQVVGFTWVVDFDGLVDWSTSDSSWWLMEIPFLAWSTILSLDHEVSTWEVVDISTLSKSGNDVEVSVYLEAPISVPFSLGWFTLPVFDIDEIPTLVVLGSWKLFVHLDLSVFSISSALDFHDNVFSSHLLLSIE